MKLETGKHGAPDALSDVEVLDDDERVVRCAACGARITHERERITMNGSHEHEFMNPAAVRYVVQCFASAPGCASEGERSNVWSWFPGFAWQIELCRGCGAHLGWSFIDSSARTFFALVKERLLS